MKTTPKVSVIIPAYNDATFLDRLLLALTKQKYDGFEVIVSDANSKDQTAGVVKFYKDRLDIKLMQNPPAGPGVGRKWHGGHKQSEAFEPICVCEILGRHPALIEIVPAVVDDSLNASNYRFHRRGLCPRTFLDGLEGSSGNLFPEPALEQVHEYRAVCARQVGAEDFVCGHLQDARAVALDGQLGLCFGGPVKKRDHAFGCRRQIELGEGVGSDQFLEIPRRSDDGSEAASDFGQAPHV